MEYVVGDAHNKQSDDVVYDEILCWLENPHFCSLAGVACRRRLSIFKD
jgi:hypothetical protein